MINEDEPVAYLLTVPAPMHPMIVHVTNLPGPNPGLPFTVVWTVSTDSEGSTYVLKLQDPFGTEIRGHQFRIP
jgi:hypothetical protein